jgi:enoyl-CoA hydratase/carnithine racemase
MSETYEQILVERRDRVVLLTLNRPEKLNAWTPTMMAELVAAIGAANDDSDVGAVVVTGAGRGFCAGADIEAVFSQNVDGGAPAAPASSDRPRQEATDWVAFCRSSKPLVAAVNGPAIGVGLTMVLPFDQILAAEGAKLSVRFVKMGVVPELASTHFLVTRCGMGAASWLALSGDTILADEAARLRLVDRVCPPDQLVDDAVAVAATLAANPPSAVRMIKDLLTVNAAESDLSAVQAREFAALKRAYASPEHHEAVKAFLDRSR